MKINSFLNKWYNKEIENWGVTTSKQYRDFESDYKKVLKETCKEIGFELKDFNKNHYDFSAVLQNKKNKLYYYISISDVRWWKNDWADKILYRTMKDEKDWTGGSNHFCKLTELADYLVNLNNQYEKSIIVENTIDENRFNELFKKFEINTKFEEDELQMFVIKNENCYTIIDNRTGKLYTEDFSKREYAVRYIKGEGIDSIREDECKYEILIYDSKEDFEQNEPFQHNVMSDLNSAKNELKDVLNMNNYYAGYIYDQETGETFWVDDELEEEEEL